MASDPVDISLLPEKFHSNFFCELFLFCSSSSHSSSAIFLSPYTTSLCISWAMSHIYASIFNFTMSPQIPLTWAPDRFLPFFRSTPLTSHYPSFCTNGNIIPPTRIFPPLCPRLTRNLGIIWDSFFFHNEHLVKYVFLCPKYLSAHWFLSIIILGSAWLHYFSYLVNFSLIFFCYPIQTFIAISVMFIKFLSKSVISLMENHKWPTLFRINFKLTSLIYDIWGPSIKWFQPNSLG